MAAAAASVKKHDWKEGINAAWSCTHCEKVITANGQTIDSKCKPTSAADLAFLPGGKGMYGTNFAKEVFECYQLVDKANLWDTLRMKKQEYYPKWESDIDEQSEYFKESSGGSLSVIWGTIRYIAKYGFKEYRDSLSECAGSTPVAIVVSDQDTKAPGVSTKVKMGEIMKIIRYLNENPDDMSDAAKEKSDTVCRMLKSLSMWSIATYLANRPEDARHFELNTRRIEAVLKSMSGNSVAAK